MANENPFGRRHFVEFFATVTLWIAVILCLPPPHRGTVNGHEVVLTTLFGHIVPDWVLKVFIAGLLGLSYGIVVSVGHRLWPEKEAAADEPDGPGLALHYVPWEGTPTMTAAEYLFEASFIPVFLTEEEEDELVTADIEARHAWLATAPEATLRDLIPECERLVDETSPGWAHGYVVKVLTAHHERGIPAREEIEAMVARIRERGAFTGDLGDWWFDREGSEEDRV